MSVKKIYLASDHAAVSLKAFVAKALKDHYEICDLGPETEDRVNYPDYAEKLCKALLSEEKQEEALGILMCGSGIGMSIMANKFRGIRAALCTTEVEASLAKQHNNANVLCLGARQRSDEVNLSLILAWLKASFEGERHQERVDRLNSLGTSLK